MAFELPALPYATNALEPHIDARTMEIHHGKHHNAYVTNLNKAIEGTEMAGKSLEELLKNHSNVPAVRQVRLRLGMALRKRRQVGNMLYCQPGQSIDARRRLQWHTYSWP